MPIVIGVDHGNGNIKTFNRAFECGLVAYEKEPQLVYEQDVVGYKDRYYVLTKHRMNPKLDKTEGEDYFILTLFALAKEAQERGINLNGKDVVLSGGLPPAEYNFYSKRFKEYFVSHATHGVTFTYNGKSITFYLKDVMLFPQDYAAVATQKQDFLKANSTVFCVDIGEGTVDLVVMRDGAPDLNTCISLKSGISSLRANIVMAAMQNYGRAIDADTVESIFQGKNVCIEDDIIELCKKEKQKWATRITDELLPYIKDFRNAPTIFLGGGAVLLKEDIKAAVAFTAVEFLEDQMANAKGYEILGNAIVGQQTQ